MSISSSMTVANAGIRLKPAKDQAQLPGMILTPEQCLGARALLRMRRSDLANAVPVSQLTLKDFEADRRHPSCCTIAAIRSVLESAGVSFTGEKGGIVGVRLTLPKGQSSPEDFVITPEQCLAARAISRMRLVDLNNAAEISVPGIIDFEAGRGVPRLLTVNKIRTALEAAGVEFIAENGGGAGVRLRERSSD